MYDRWFCSIMDSTYPNRHYQWGAQDGGTRGNQLPSGAGFAWETIFDRAIARGVSARYYYSDLPFAALYGSRGVAWSHPVSQFYSDAAAGRLPNIAFVDPSFVGEEQGISGDEHPHGDIRVGQAFMSDVVHAFMESPQYRRGVLFIDYDEWGGFFDHVKPRHVPDDREDPAHLYGDYGLTGFRTPGVCVSPFSRSGGVCHMGTTHESVLKLISYRWRLGHLNKRHRYATNLGRTLDFGSPALPPPSLPDPTAIARHSLQLRRRAGRQDGAAETARHGQAADLGPARALRLRGPTPSFDQLFRQPDSVQRALRNSTP